MQPVHLIREKLPPEISDGLHRIRGRFRLSAAKMLEIMQAPFGLSQLLRAFRGVSLYYPHWVLVVQFVRKYEAGHIELGNPVVPREVAAMIDGLVGVKNDRGTVIFLCRDCGIPPSEAYGAQNESRLVFVLMCSKCGRVFGEWASRQERDIDLRQFATLVKQRT